jgi:hypothetical protein
MTMIVVTNENSPEQESQQLPAGQEPDWANQESSTLRSLTRLLIGGALVGWDQLHIHLNKWETSVEAQPASPTGSDESDDSSAVASSEITIRNSLIGILFEAQDRSLRRGKQLLNLAGRTGAAFASPLERQLDQNPRLTPVRSRFDKLVARGETAAERWVKRGRLEEDRSRRLAMTAGGEGFNTFMDRLGEAPALQDLVRKQSAGLTQDAIDVVRTRTVSGDMMAESVARSLLRRKPRHELAPPPTAGDQKDETSQETS